MNRNAAMVRRAAIRLGLQFGGGTALLVVVLAAVTAIVVVQTGRTADDALLNDTVARADDVIDPAPGVWLALRGPDGSAVSPHAPTGIPDVAAMDRVGAGGPAEMKDLHVGGREYRVRTIRRDTLGDDPHGPFVVQAALDLAARRNQLDMLLEALAIAGLGGLALSAAAGAWFGRRAVRPLAAALSLQRRFVADAGHELRTPLTLLSTRAQVLRRRLRTGDDVHGVADAMVADVERLATVLDDLLLAADPRGGPGEAVDVAAVAEELVAAARTDTGVTIDAHRPPGPALVTGSIGGVRRALTALVDNAVRHARSRVAVAVEVTKRSVVVLVTDDGPGIAEDVLPRLFDRFVSAEDGPSTGSRRYGLGLALVSEIAARHGGWVTAANTDGGGAKLRLELPRLQGTSEIGPPP